MKRWIALWVSIVLIFTLSACGNNKQNSTNNEEESETVADNIQESEKSKETSGMGEPADAAEPENSLAESGISDAGTQEADEQGSNVLIAYFSVPEDVDISGVDAVAGASIVVRNSDVSGNTEYVAKVVQQTIGGDLFRIETVQQYPLDHDPLVDQAADEQDEDARPELATQVENLDQYDYIILGFPNWWGDLPMPLYTFLEEYDFGGKTIIPFVTHGGSGFSDTRNTIARLQPDAEVSSNTLSLSRNNVADSEEEIISWAESLGVN